MWCRPATTRRRATDNTSASSEETCTPRPYPRGWRARSPRLRNGPMGLTPALRDDPPMVADSEGECSRGWPYPSGSAARPNPWSCGDSQGGERAGGARRTALDRQIRWGRKTARDLADCQQALAYCGPGWGGVAVNQTKPNQTKHAAAARRTLAHDSTLLTPLTAARFMAICVRTLVRSPSPSGQPRLRPHTAHGQAQ